jgi:hypothetical protein
MLENKLYARVRRRISRDLARCRSGPNHLPASGRNNVKRCGSGPNRLPASAREAVRFPAESFARIGRNNAKRCGSGPNRLPASTREAVRFPAESFARIGRNNAKRCGFGIRQNLVLEFGLMRNNAKRCGSEAKPETHRFAPLRASVSDQIMWV